MTEAIIAFFFGLLGGSFLNVCIHRWPRGRSVVRPRSHCVRCRKLVAWYDNIPVMSYLILGGRCRHCHRHISLRYPTVELLTGLLFYWFVRHQGVTLDAAKMCVFSAILVALTFCDLEKRLLPDQFTKGGMWLGFLFAFFVKVPDFTAQAISFFVGIHLTGLADRVVESVLGAAAPALLLWGGAWLWGYLRGREMLGFGDVKLVAMVGSFLGLYGAMLTMLLGAVSGSIIGTAYIVATKRKLSEYELPFGTFLGIAGLAVTLLAKWCLPGG